MTRVQAKVIIGRLMDRGLSPVITKISDDEYTIGVNIPSEATQFITPTDLQGVIDMGVGVVVESVKFT